MPNSHETARARLIYDLGRSFASKIELEELIPLVVSKCREVLDAEGVSVLLLDRDRNELYFPYVSQENPEVAGRLTQMRFPADRGIAGAVLHSRKSEKVDQVAADRRHYSDVDRHTRATTKSILAAPLIAGDTALGVIEAVNHRGGAPFSEEDLSLLETLAESISVAIDNASRFSKVQASEKLLRLQVGALRRDLAQRDIFTEIIAISPAMSEVFRLMESAAASSIAVLIEGETGTGKELVARAIHRASARADGPFIAVNCAAFTETLLESELFGHRRGAFTGATAEQPGLFKAASGGVIFLDEIGEMPVQMQPKLLRVVQEGEVMAVGDTHPQKVDVRVLSATNTDLKAAIAKRTFREDLYYRLAVFPIRLPPLRDRREDITILANRFLSAAAELNHKRLPGFDPAALDLLVEFNWPGNVRQLQNMVQRAAALARDGEVIGTGHLSIETSPAKSPQSPNTKVAPERDKVLPPLANEADGAHSSLRDARAAFEARFISQVLTEHSGNVSHAAVALGISRVALQKKMKLYDLR